MNNGFLIKYYVINFLFRQVWIWSFGLTKTPHILYNEDSKRIFSYMHTLFFAFLLEFKIKVIPLPPDNKKKNVRARPTYGHFACKEPS